MAIYRYVIALRIAGITTTVGVRGVRVTPVVMQIAPIIAALGSIRTQAALIVT